jgi:hypothetical protein
MAARRFWIPVFLVSVAACGGGTGQHDAGDDTGGADGGGDDTGTPDAGGGGPDAPGGGPDGSGGGPDGGGGGADAAPPGPCEAGIAPTQLTQMSSTSNLNFVTILAAGGQVFATAPFGVPSSTWLRWTGSAWSQETIPWPTNLPSPTGISSVVQLPDGDALLVSGLWMTTFDGVSMTDAVEVPASAGNAWGYARSPAGQLHVFGVVGTSSGNMHVEVVENPAGGWYPAAPIPIPGSVNNRIGIVATDGRVVVAYTNIFFDDDDPVHVHVVSRAPASTWTAEQDITPTWAVRAYNLRALAAPGGGVILGASGAGSVIWRSVDGVTFGEYEQASAYGWLASIHAQCLDSPIVVAGYQTSYRLEGRVGGSWTTLKQRTLSYIDNAGAVILPTGKTYFALGESNQHEYFATP